MHSFISLSLLAAATVSAQSFWRPPVSATWDIVLNNPVSSSFVSSFSRQVLDFDLFENNASTITTLHNKGVKVICYFSAGSREDWRDDAGDFPQSDIGNPLTGWEGENWINVRSQKVREIMSKRLDLAKQIGCDAVDPDNVDGFENDNQGGLNLTPADAIDYVRWLASESHRRGMACGLKNSLEIVEDVVGNVDFQVNEECGVKPEPDECDGFQPFITAGKPVFEIEYPDGAPGNIPQSIVKGFCDNPKADGFMTVLKDMGLGEWSIACP